MGPETTDVIRELAAEGIKELVVIPVSFISDHIETLHEIDIELKEIAMQCGIEKFIRTKCFNDDIRFINFLASMIEEKVCKGLEHQT